MYRSNEGQDIEKVELRRRLQVVEAEIVRLKEERREKGFWTKQRKLSFGKELALLTFVLLLGLSLLFLPVLGLGIKEEAYHRRNAILYSVNHFHSSRVSVRCEAGACQGRDNLGHYVILRCDQRRCWRVW